MEDIRKGNDFGIEWSIFADQDKTAPYDLTGRNLTLYVSNQYGQFKAANFTTEGNVLKWTFLGKEQRQLGVHTLTLVENDGLSDMHTVDFCRAFRLVARSCEASQNDNGTMTVTYLHLSSSMSFVTAEGKLPGVEGGGSESGGSINQMTLEGYMPMMREFSDDYNDDFTR